MPIVNVTVCPLDRIACISYDHLPAPIAFKLAELNSILKVVSLIILIGFINTVGLSILNVTVAPVKEGQPSELISNALPSDA